MTAVVEQYLRLTDDPEPGWPDLAAGLAAIARQRAGADGDELQWRDRDGFLRAWHERLWSP